MPAGRPKRVFTEEQIVKIEEMALDNCHLDTIGLALGIPLETLRRNYGVFISQKRAEGRTILHRQQKEKCNKSDTTMLIWRGKQDLGQSDKKEIFGKDGAPLVPLSIVVKPERDNG